MTEGQADLIRYRMQRAAETLQEARVMVDSGHLHGAANRIYYACFYAAVAILLTRNLSSPRHSGVMALLNKHFIKEGILPVDMGRFYSRIFDSRLESDYGDIAEPELADVKADLEKAQEFVSQVRAHLDQL
jgi:uncharacterized protein (UPF0332 family)